MSLDAPLILLAIATVLTGLLAGISLDKWVVQLPARHQIGIRPFAAFSRANDLGNGLVLYPVLGVGAAMVTIAAALIANSPRLTGTPAWAVDSSAVLATLHSLVTTRAAPHPSAQASRHRSSGKWPQRSTASPHSTRRERYCNC